MKGENEYGGEVHAERFFRQTEQFTHSMATVACCCRFQARLFHILAYLDPACLAGMPQSPLRPAG